MPDLNPFVTAPYLAVWARADGVHGSGLQIHQDGTGDVATAGGLTAGKKGSKGAFSTGDHTNR